MNPTPTERIAVTASRLLADHRVVFAGVGTPLVASILATRLQAPHLSIVLEGGIIGIRVPTGELPISTNEMRAARGATMLTDITDVFLYAQRGSFDYGLLGAAQIDRFGNINTSVIGDHDRPKVRLPGSGGANDISSLCREIMVLTTHEQRRFVDRVDFITSPGYLRGGTSREEAGLLFGCPTRIVTDLAVLDFEPVSRHVRLRELQPGVSVEQVRAATGFDLPVADELGTVEPPTAEELGVLRGLHGFVAGGSSGSAARG
jgi:glutaconate CoA-transferase subunit B